MAVVGAAGLHGRTTRLAEAHGIRRRAIKPARGEREGGREGMLGGRKGRWEKKSDV